MEISLEKIKKIHFTGIKGVGMTALALCFLDLRKKVTGSDVSEKFVTDEVLKKAKINYQIGFKKEDIDHPDLLIYTGAHGGAENPQVVFARQNQIPTLSQAQALGWLMSQKEGISICGVGGKTTTSALLATVLFQAGLKPSYAIGVGAIKPLFWPGHFDFQGRYFVAEADEYMTSPQDSTPRFFYQKPKVIILTNIEFDHPDFYPNLKATLRSFEKFLLKIPKEGLVVACLDNPRVEKLLKRIKIPYQTYGFNPKADWQITKIKIKTQGTDFWLRFRKNDLGKLSILLPGKFNVLNATAVVATASFLGLPWKQIKNGLNTFEGTKRRFEFIKEVKGRFLYDDYAHHPSEIKATLQTAKQWLKPQRLLVIFQPHTYTRTKYLLKDFAQSFQLADRVIITDIYASAREKENLGITAQSLVEAISKKQREVYYFPNCEELSYFLRRKTLRGEVIFTLGAGSIFLWHDKIIKALTKTDF